MSVFDLTDIQKLVEAKHPPIVILADTNVIMNNPDFSKWRTDLQDPVIVLTHATVAELAKLKEKKVKDEKEPSTKDKARAALDALLWLTEQGDTWKGIYVKEVGWFITLKLPAKDIMEPELRKLRSIQEMCYETDTTLLLIHMELAKSLPRTPILSLTGDKLYTFLGRDLGLLVFPARSFPLQLSDWVRSKMPRITIDPDKELEEAVKRIEENAIIVELTLIGKRLDERYHFEFPKGVNRSGMIIAEGHGILHHPEIGKISFLWQLPYKPWTSKMLAGDPFIGEPDLYNDQPTNVGVWQVPFLDFLGRYEDIPTYLYMAIGAKIIEHSVPPAIDSTLPPSAPCLQSPSCIAECLMNTLDHDPLASSEELLEYCDGYLSRSSDIDRCEFLANILRVWNVGHTIKAILPPEYILDFKGTLEEE